MNHLKELSLLPESYFGKLNITDSCESTQTLVRSLAEFKHPNESTLFAPHGTAIQTLNQTAGHGRQGKNWVGTPGNLFLSVLLKDSILFGSNSIARTWTPLVVGYTLLQLLKSEFPSLEIKIKWPNDLRIRKKKFAGILVDSFSVNGELTYIVGIGMNVSTSAIALDQATTSIHEELVNPLSNPSNHIDLGKVIYDKFHDLQIIESVNAIKTAILPELEETFSKEEFGPCSVLGLGDFGELILRDLAGKTHSVTSAS